jgi:iron complex outermembrane recepter protein
MMDIPRLEKDGRGRVWPGLLVSLYLVLSVFSGCGPEIPEDTIRFDVSVGPAVMTLKEAARQAEVEFIFSSDLMQGLNTPALKGKYTPSEAFRIMLADSPFIVVQHQESGVYSIQKAQMPKHP